VAIQTTKFDDKHFTAKGIDEELEANLQNYWNGNVVDYDDSKYNFSAWILDQVNKLGYELDDLTRLHEVVPDKDVFVLTKNLCAATNSPKFTRMVHNYVRDVVVPKGDLEFPVAVQRYVNVRIMLPNKPSSIFPFHTGILYGHGPASRSLWMPMTDVTPDDMSTASMQIIDIDESRDLIKTAVEERYDVDTMTEVFGKNSYPLKACSGKAVFFSQENIHGNFVNTTGKTRVSMDFRVAEGRFGNLLARKIAGGYFKIIPNTEAEEDSWSKKSEASRSRDFDNGKRNILYIHNATKATRYVPVHLQRLMIYDYAKTNDMNYQFEYFDLEDMTHLPTLQYVIKQLECNPVLYSVYCLPEDPEFRKELEAAVLERGLIMHFVNENMVMANQHDVDEIETLLAFAKYDEQ
jgi:sporadic carbohydrate cluster 2OG-Fe(II) oxygenase/sporadic carbohydrate cluster protein (TIGR04323 family)